MLLSHLNKVSILGMEEREIVGKCKKIKVKNRNSEIRILESSFPTNELWENAFNEENRISKKPQHITDNLSICCDL